MIRYQYFDLFVMITHNNYNKYMCEVRDIENYAPIFLAFTSELTYFLSVNLIM